MSLCLFFPLEEYHSSKKMVRQVFNICKGDQNKSELSPKYQNQVLLTGKYSK